VEGENSPSGPQPYRAEVTNQITPEIPTGHTRHSVVTHANVRRRVLRIKSKVV